MTHTFITIVIAHHHPRRAATGETFDEFDCELRVSRRLQDVLVRIEAQLLAKMFVQLVRTAERATERAANLDLIFPDRLLPEHRVKRDEFVNVDRLQAELLGSPLHGFHRNPAEALLDRVQHHERRASLLRIMRDQLINHRFQRWGHCKAGLSLRQTWDWLSDRRVHRSHSPITKSSEPRIAVTSLTIWPGSRCDRMLRLQNDGARILSRCGVPPPLLLM